MSQWRVEWPILGGKMHAFNKDTSKPLCNGKAQRSGDPGIEVERRLYLCKHCARELAKIT